MDSTAIERIDSFMESGFNKIEGWVVPTIKNILKSISIVQDHHQIQGGIFEIGVHHGKFFILLCQLLRTDEFALAIDLFSKQELNIDHSGRGGYEAFSSNVDSYCPNPFHIMSLEADSLDLQPEDIRSKIGSARLISVDGGHTCEHTLHDIHLSSQLITGGGVIILDDYYNQEWPGVHEGFIKYMLNHNRKLCPFAYQGNKLFLTTISWHQIFLREIAHLTPNHKIVKMSGFDVISIK
jgi:hypothetical protein